MQINTKFYSFLLFLLLAQSLEARTVKATTNINVLPANSGFGVLGQIDSSYFNRFLTTGNAIYIYSGSITNPGELGSAANAPLAIAEIKQDKCVFTYQTPQLTKGPYTLAITQSASLDKPGSLDGITFIASAQVNYANDIANQVYNFTPKGRVLRVGSGQTYSKPSLAINASQAGDIIEIDSGTYTDDFAVISNNITLRGVGASRPLIKRVNGVIPNGKGIWTTLAPTRIENIEISGARVPDQNGAGIRIENDTVICNAYLHDNENGVLGDAQNIRIEYSEVAANGLTDVGFTHNIYVNAEVFTLIYSYIHDAHDPNNTSDTGHNVKSRSRTNYILYNRIMNEDVGTAGDQINLPQGGLSYIVGNVIRESAKSSSNRIILFYDGADGPANASRELFLINNTIVSDDGEAYLTAGAGTTTHTHNNLLFGTPKTVVGTTQSNNLFSTNSAIFLNKTTYDFHPVAGSPAINAGLDVSTITNFKLKIDSEYVHPQSSKKRIQNGLLDAGAFEF